MKTPIMVRVDEPMCRVTRLSYPKRYSEKNNKRVERVLDRLAAEFDKLGEMGVQARISYSKA